MRRLLAIIGPGLLVAATGVGAGDLATATFAGGKLGTAVLWGVVVGAAMKLAVTEGLARFQLATGLTFLEGVVARLGRAPVALFMPYFLLWTFFVGSALIAACGVTIHSMVPVFDDPARGKIVFGIAASAVGVALVVAGGYSLFSRVMSACIAVMFAAVVVTAILLWPGTGEVAAGLIPDPAALRGDGLTWTVALIGGVGGTVTVLCYGYWIREEGRTDPADLRVSRIDLTTGYAMTAVFGLAMVIIGSRVTVGGTGSGLIVALADALEGPLGPVGRWVFLIGAFGAVFSSLLGVWQAVPYLFADMFGLLRGGERVDVDTKAAPYRAYLAAIATVPCLGLLTSFKEIQKLYATIGAAFLPMLALALLVLNARRHGAVAVVSLLSTLGFFGWIAARSWLG